MVEDILIEKTIPATIVGIDLGLKDLIITSEKVKYRNDKVLEKYERDYKKNYQAQLKEVRII